MSTGRRTLVRIVLLLGLLLLVYPTAANWFAVRNHNDRITEYQQLVEDRAPKQLSRALERAHAYNRTLPRGLLRDPYSTHAARSESEQDMYAAYEKLLRVPGTDVIGRVRYPALDIDLPIQHGTGDEAISTGAGHVHGSSLPVGGPSTHSVLTAHSGLVRAALFTPLHDAREGQLFTVEVLDQVLTYRVDSITTIAADETRALRIEEGQDHVTLLTCTPVGVNSHRLLVRGARVPTPAADPVGGVTSDDDVTLPFPWWAVVLAGGTVIVLLLTRRRDEPDPDEEAGQSPYDA